MARQEMIETQTVIFIDALGFAEQVLRDDGALGLLDSFYNSGHTFDELIRSFDDERRTTALIERLFALFHVGLEEEIAQALKASHLHSIVFSDSAFVAFEHPADGLYFCQAVMRKMIRGGVRYGWALRKGRLSRSGSRPTWRATSRSTVRTSSALAS